jgi:Uma2 family endonuclease
MAEPAVPLPVPPLPERPRRTFTWPEEVEPVWPEDRSRWFLPEPSEPFPLDTFLTHLQHYLAAVFRLLFDEQGKAWFAGYEQRMRLDEFDGRLGVYPDFYVLPCEPKEPYFDQWPAYLEEVPGPIFAVEVVSRSNWEKDYFEAPGKYAMLGTQELVLFDPLALEGKSPANPAYVLQVYRRGKRGNLRREYAGEGPVYSEVMGVWLHAEEKGLQVTRDEEGKEPVLTRQEAESWWKELKEARRREERERRERLIAEQQRRDAEEQKRLAEEQKRLAEERERLAEQRRRDAEEQKRLAEQHRRDAEEQKRLAEQQALADARQAVVDLCDLLSLDLTPERQAHLASLDLAGLRSLRAHLKQTRSWPTLRRVGQGRSGGDGSPWPRTGRARRRPRWMSTSSPPAPPTWPPCSPRSSGPEAPR